MNMMGGIWELQLMETMDMKPKDVRGCLYFPFNLFPV